MSLLPKTMVVTEKISLDASQSVVQMAGVNVLAGQE